jgi:NADPH-dependent 2,4-dienoyl-CoA reductase/sulfur reductase-like enzyme
MIERDHEDLPSARRLVVVGASLAGLRAVQSARRAGFDGAIALIGSEPHLPYDRPPLSKSYLDASGAPDFFVTPEEVDDLDVSLRLSTTATALDSSRREIHLDDGTRLAYDSAVIATGASPRRIPSFPDLDGIVTLRTLDDADEIRSRLRPGLAVVIVGAGFIGSEIASAAHARGADVTILEAAPVPLVRAVGTEVGAAISALHGRNGVRLVVDARIEEVSGSGGRVSAVRLADDETIPADLVIVGVGAAPATTWLQGSGIDLHAADGGVLCDAYLETSVPDVYSAGDIVHWPNGLLDATMRLENWTSAADQGAAAGANAVTAREDRAVFQTVPYFWSDWYGQRIQFVGTATADAVEFVSGDATSDRFVAFYRSGDRLVGAATLNEQRTVMKLRRLIQNRGSWDEAVALLASLEAARAVAPSAR